MTGAINGVAVHGSLRPRRGELRSYGGELTVGDNDAPKLLAMMTADAPIVYTGPVTEDGVTKTVKIAVLIRIRTGTVATVVEVQSSGPPIE